MTLHAKGSPPGREGDPIDAVCLSANASFTINPALLQENILEAIKAFAAGEICADTLENIPLMLAASGWRATAALLTHAAGCADAGDFLNAERNRQSARGPFIAANDAFREFMEASAAEATRLAYQ